MRLLHRQTPLPGNVERRLWVNRYYWLKVLPNVVERISLTMLVPKLKEWRFRVVCGSKASPLGRFFFEGGRILLAINLTLTYLLLICFACFPIRGPYILSLILKPYL